MRLTIIKEDGLVIIDGLGFRGIDMSSMPSDFWALQWYEIWGEEERRNPETRAMTNVAVDDLTPYQGLIDQWQEKRAASEIPDPPLQP